MYTQPLVNQKLKRKGLRSHECCYENMSKTMNEKTLEWCYLMEEDLERCRHLAHFDIGPELSSLSLPSTRPGLNSP